MKISQGSSFPVLFTFAFALYASPSKPSKTWGRGKEGEGEGDEEDENVDVGALGKDGKVNFLCALPAQGKTNISMQWEIGAPAKTKIYEL